MKTARQATKLSGELDEVEVELLGGLVEPVLVDRLDALGGQPQPHEPLPLLPVELAPLQVQVLDLLRVVGAAAQTSKRKGHEPFRPRTPEGKKACFWLKQLASFELLLCRLSTDSPTL